MRQEEKTTFAESIDAFHEMALPFYMNFKSPSFFKVQACIGDQCTEFSEPDAGQAELIP